MSAPVNMDIDVAENQIVYTRVFAAPRDLVFEAWTRPEHVRWWWGPRGFTVTVCEIDLRPGGAYRFVHRGPDGNDYPFKGVYRGIVPPERLVYTQIFDVPGLSVRELLVSLTFDEHDGATLLMGCLLFESVEDRVAAMEMGMAQGMAETLDRLEEHLAATGTGDERMSAGGLSAVRLGRMHDVMAGRVASGDVPGLVTLVSRRGQVHVDAIGTTSLGGSDPMRRDTIFRISSMTKPITAAAAMILVEECKLRLDEPVDRLLPELADRKVLTRLDGPLGDTGSANRRITVRDLLAFTMGFGIVKAPPDTYPIQQAMSGLQLGQGPPSPAAPPAPDEWIRRLGTLPLMHQPGERWMYNTGSDVLGVLVARASGRPFETFLRERIFEPLGMNDTGFNVPAARLGRFATAYWTDPETGALALYDEAEDGQPSRPPAFPSGAGGLVSTVDDYLAFGQMMLDQGRHGSERMLSRLSVETMTIDQLTPDQKAVSGLVPGYFDRHGWGLGVSIVTRRDGVAGSVGKFGWDGGLDTSWYSDPREDMVTILMTQRVWTSASPPDVCLDFWTSAYQAIDD